MVRVHFNVAGAQQLKTRSGRSQRYWQEFGLSRSWAVTTTHAWSVGNQLELSLRRRLAIFQRAQLVPFPYAFQLSLREERRTAVLFVLTSRQETSTREYTLLGSEAGESEFAGVLR